MDHQAIMQSCLCISMQLMVVVLHPSYLLFLYQRIDKRVKVPLVKVWCSMKSVWMVGVERKAEKSRWAASYRAESRAVMLLFFGAFFPVRPIKDGLESTNLSLHLPLTSSHTLTHDFEEPRLLFFPCYFSSQVS